MREYYTVVGESVGELTVERSRFIASAMHIDSEKDALDYIARKRLEYHDARHNCFAFLLHDGLVRSSDDGEPHGTAGKPILDVISGSGISDICVLVTRYFGGVLLGTGGLVRAYSSAARLSLENAERVKMQPCAEYRLCCSYSDYAYLERVVLQFGIIESTDFTDTVSVTAAIRAAEEEDFAAAVEKIFLTTVKSEKICDTVLPV